MEGPQTLRADCIGTPAMASDQILIPVPALPRASTPRKVGVVPMLFDYAAATALLMLLTVPLAAIAILIKLESEGPVFFRQPRVGLNNRIFKIWKFRTMYHANTDLAGAQLTTRNDPRITQVGAWLRKWSIDELPQLLNVLSGHMSLVGPRPHPISAKAGERLYQDVVPNYNRRHTVKPGITGWAQVCGWRGETETAYQIQQRVAHDLEYIEKYSLALDLRILWLTLRNEINSKVAF